MAKERGWWEFKANVEPSTTDLEHIAQMIEQGYTSGEIVQDEDQECAHCGKEDCPGTCER